MDLNNNELVTFKECIVIGAGISGLAVGRWLKQYKIDFIMLEKSNNIGGLWRYREDDYGVMDFTHINVSKYNYCYSDHPFPKETNDYPHHSEIYKYVTSYAEKHNLYENIKFNIEVVLIEEMKRNDPLINSINEVNRSSDKKLWKIKIENLETNEEKVMVTNYLCLASGHHSVPQNVTFSGQETFKGEIIHSVKYKSATFNKMKNKKVLVVGIGNSAVDIACNLYEEGNCSKVMISARSGAWIFPNYISGFATDLYSCRTFLFISSKIRSYILEIIIKFIYGSPKMLNLFPKNNNTTRRVAPLETQPIVNSTIVHHIQRQDITIKSNIKSISGSEITFENDEKESFDSIILSTGYKIGLNYLHPQIKKNIFKDNNETTLNLYKMVFNPEIGNSLGFIGFIQPLTGGLVSCSETQARWFVHLMRKDINLPPKVSMIKEIETIENAIVKRFKSGHHTVQRDPITYNDEITEMFGAKPRFLNDISNLKILLTSSCGPAQWRLNGPDSMSHEAKNMIKKVPITPMMKNALPVLIALPIYLFYQIYNYPLFFSGLICVYYLFKFFNKSRK